jgi:superfamily II DNA or RNA helicase
MDIITIEKKNEVYLRVQCEAGIAYELSDHFSFDVPGARWQPLVKAGVWDGKIRVYNVNKRELPIGLYPDLKEFCESRNYTLQVSASAEYGLPDQVTNITPEELYEFIKGLNLHTRGEKLEVRDYQYEAIYKAIKYRRRTIISPTGSGKSAIIYCLTRYMQECDLNTLIVVPTTQLVEQMYKDFGDYSSEIEWDVEEHVHRIYSGHEKKTHKNIVVSTWQSLQRMAPEWFHKFSCVMIDEVQGAKSKQLQALLEKCTEAFMRFGLTGSLDNSQTHQTMIRGMIGPIMRVAKTKELIEQGHLSDIKIKAITLDYSNETKHALKRIEYNKEVQFLVAHEKRNKFIRNLALSLEGNTLILYTLVEKHGEILYNMIDEKADGRHTFFIHGGVDVEDREQVGTIMRTHKNAIAVCSFGTFAAGVNIPELNNIILASPTKSVVRVLQSLGRGLRKAKGKTHFTLYDLGDRMSVSKKNPNHTYKHFIERLNIYLKEQFEYTLVEVDLE